MISFLFMSLHDFSFEERFFCKVILCDGLVPRNLRTILFTCFFQILYAKRGQLEIIRNWENIQEPSLLYIQIQHAIQPLKFLDSVISTCHIG